MEPYKDVWPRVDPSVFVHPTAVLIGDIELAEGVSIWPNATLRGDDGRIVIGARSNIQDGVVVHMTDNLSHTIVGCRVTVGHNAILHGCRVADRCLIGMGAIVMDNAEVGEGSLIGAGALVSANKVIPPGSLVVGNPGRVKRAVTDEERRWIDHSWSHYYENAQRYRDAAADAGRGAPG